MSLSTHRSIGLVIPQPTNHDLIELNLRKSSQTRLAWAAVGAKEARTKFEEHPVDVLITEIDLHDGNGLGLAISLKNQNPDLGTIFVVERTSKQLQVPFELGRSGRVIMSSELNHTGSLERAIHLATTALNGIKHKESHKGLSELTPRQLQVLAEVAQGYGNQAISERLGIELSSVVNHLTAVYACLAIPEEANPRVFATLVYYELA